MMNVVILMQKFTLPMAQLSNPTNLMVTHLVVMMVRKDCHCDRIGKIIFNRLYLKRIQRNNWGIGS